MSDKKPKALWWCDRKQSAHEKDPSTDCVWHGRPHLCWKQSGSIGKCTAIKYTPERREK